MSFFFSCIQFLSDLVPAEHARAVKAVGPALWKQEDQFMLRTFGEAVRDAFNLKEHNSVYSLSPAATQGCHQPYEHCRGLVTGGKGMLMPGGGAMRMDPFCYIDSSDISLAHDND